MLNAEQAEEARDILEAAALVVEEVNTFLGSRLLRDAVVSIRIVALGFNPDLAMGLKLSQQAIGQGKENEVMSLCDTCVYDYQWAMKRSSFVSRNEDSWRVCSVMPKEAKLRQGERCNHLRSRQHQET